MSEDQSFYDGVDRLHREAAGNALRLSAVENKLAVLAESIPTPSDLAPLVSRAECTTDVPERYIRVAVTKNTRGYQGETTVSLRGANWSIDELRELLVESDTLLREEIVRREAMDACDGSNAELCSESLGKQLRDSLEARRVLS